MATLTQYEVREFCGFQIRQRISDGYISATDMCKTEGKLIADYTRSKQTKAFLSELVSMDKHIINPILTLRGENYNGTLVHPRVAVHLAQWISAKLAVKITDWVLRYMQGDITLVKEIVQQHDIVNNTTSTVIVDTVDNTLTTEERRETLKITKIKILTLCLDLSDRIGADDRVKSMAQDSLLQIMGNKATVADKEDKDEYSISLRLNEKFGFQATTKERKGFASNLGKIMLKSYIDYYKSRPPQRKQFVDGTLRSVNHYVLADFVNFGDAVLEENLRQKCWLR